MSGHRDVAVAHHPAHARGATGRKVIAVIGIDRYRSWSALGNAVRDAEAVRSLFLRLGFEELTRPLVDDAATGKAMEALVTDDLMALGPDDSLVMFYAGHGGTRTQHLDGKELRTGYLIPVDAANEPDRVATWIELDSWLRRISRLPPRHILVILDACYSGIALSPVTGWGHDVGGRGAAPRRARRSRLIITSARDDQLACDRGPAPGHSPFAGCLIEALTGGLPGDVLPDGRRVTTGSELGQYLRRRLRRSPGGAGALQTPDFGGFELDERGEMELPILVDGGAAAPFAARHRTRPERMPWRRLPNAVPLRGEAVRTLPPWEPTDPMHRPELCVVFAPVAAASVAMLLVPVAPVAMLPVAPVPPAHAGSAHAGSAHARPVAAPQPALTSAAGRWKIAAIIVLLGAVVVVAGTLHADDAGDIARVPSCLGASFDAGADTAAEVGPAPLPQIQS